MTLAFSWGVPLRGGAVVNRALAMPRSRPFGLPSHTPARSACHAYQARDHLSSVRAVAHAVLHPYFNGLIAFA